MGHAAGKQIDRQLGDFTILGELGRGGMGVVYRARQESMGRIVALKTLPSFIGMDPSSVARFRREAEAAGRLSHPGIVPIYAVGETDGIHYYAMELVEGPSLATVLDRIGEREPSRLRGTLPEESGCSGVAELGPAESLVPGARYACSCAAIAAELASALTAAHRGMVIHRDLKPSNVLLRKSGMPVLVDFGLARDEMTLGLTQSGDALGTPSYMAPEQACGAKDLDARVDIYGLGALLYEMLTLRPPFDGTHAPEVMRRIVDEDFVPVRQLNPRVPVDLEKIVHTCLAKHPDDRYAAAEALEMDLRAFLEGRAIVARRPSLLARLARVARRDRRAMAAGVIVLTVSSAAFGVIGAVADHRAEREGHAALHAARTASIRARFDEAQEAYGRARVLLGDEPVGEARQRDLPVVFEALYGALRLDELSVYLESWPAAERGANWRRLSNRLEGRGRLRVDAPEGAAVELRRADAGSDAWQPLRVGAELPLTEFFVRVSVPGATPTVQRAEIRRDAETQVEPLLVPAASAPPDAVLVIDPTRRVPTFVDRTELSCKRYRSLLATIEDDALRAELEPADWVTQTDDELPVRGLSFAQARIAAAMLGGHLLNEEEYRLASTAGVEALVHPWGSTFEPNAVAADPARLSEPLPVTSKESGASPHGVLHLVGNVADMLAPSFGTWRVSVAGGHFQSPPAELTCAHRDRLDGMGVQKSWVGIRLGRFADPTPRPAGRAELEELERALFEGADWAIAHRWTVRETGQVRLGLRLVGRQGEAVTRQALPLITEGFGQVGELLARDGFDRPIRATRVVDVRGEASRVTLEYARPFQRGQQFRLALETDLEPRSGLTGRGDVYSLHVPLRTMSSLRSLVTVELPVGCRVEEADPEPTTVVYEQGAPVLAWYLDTHLGGALAMPAVVRFRRDGPLTASWPTKAAVVATLEQLFAALASRDSAQLDALLAPDFCERFRMLGRTEYMRAHAARSDTERIDRYELRDFVAVGETITAWLDIDWTITGRDGAAVSLSSWPLRVTMRRESDGHRVVEIAPAGRADSGELTASGYRHEGLQCELRPPSDLAVQVRRGDGHMAEMQVTCVPGGDLEGVSYSLFGIRTEVDDRAEDVRHRLTNGSWSLRRGRGVDGPRVGVLGTLQFAPRTRALHWLFPVAGGEGVDRETWTVLQRGRRWFLARARARGATEEEAIERFRRARAFFDAMATSVSIRDEAF